MTTSKSEREKKRKMAIQLFERFLKNKRCFDDFVYNCNNVTPCSSSPVRENQNFDRYIANTYKPEMFIFRAFIWRDSEQGHAFWEEINHQWKTLLLKNDLDGLYY